MFPLNAIYGAKETNNRTAAGVPSGVSLALGPDGKANGSYEFNGTSNSSIEFPNSAGGALDVRHSMTMLCWLYHGGQDGPLFDYGTSGKWGTRLWVVNGKLLVRLTKRSYSITQALSSTTLSGGWKFVGASYDHVSGEAKLWVDGAVVQSLNIGAGHELATQGSIRMGATTGIWGYFKGRIAKMQVYKTSLNQEQIRAIQNMTQVTGEFYSKNKCHHLLKLNSFNSLFSEIAMNSTMLLKNDSYIYSDHLRQFLKPVVGNESRWLPCYRASSHGWLVSTFHRRCDGKMNTVTIIKKDEYVFGAFTDIPWGEKVVNYFFVYFSFFP